MSKFFETRYNVEIAFPKYNKKGEQIGHHKYQVWSQRKTHDDATALVKALISKHPNALVRVTMTEYYAELSL
jgi:hypothetical protein